MRAEELAIELLKHPDFDVIFGFTEPSGKWIKLRTFKNINIADIGYSEGVICLDGDED